MQCQYNGDEKPNPKGINNGATGFCNPDYISFEKDPLSTVIVMRGKLYSGDLPKDDSDLSQQGPAGAKCPTTRLATCCNLIGQCTYIYQPQKTYTMTFDILIDIVHSGWDFNMHSVNGVDYNLIYLTDKTTSNPIKGAWYIGLVEPTQQNEIDPQYLRRITPLDDIYTDGITVNKWMNWTFKVCMEGGCDDITAGSKGYVEASLNGGSTLGANWARLDLPEASRGTNAKFGVTSLAKDCATADFQYYMKNIGLYEGYPISAGNFQNDLDAWVTPLPYYTGAAGAPKTNDPNAYADYPAFSTVEADGPAVFEPQEFNIGGTVNTKAPKTSTTKAPKTGKSKKTKKSKTKKTKTSTLR